MNERIKVIARFRPGDPSSVYNIQDETVFVEGKPYTFDAVKSGAVSQEDIFNTTACPIVEELLNGYNATIFVYGQTSSGKTYTMEGDISGSERGIMPRAVDQIFAHIAQREENIEFTIKISYYEIYMEKIRDLLDPNKKNLTIHEDKTKCTYVRNVTERYVDTPQQIVDLLREGKRNRAVAVTDMNEHSSRSHSVFQITVSQCNMTNQQKLSSKLYLVDLAGSEKTSKTNAQGMTLDEAKKINSSLMCLGKVISALSEGHTHVPYRDSKLTRVLQHSLGGNSRTTIIICMSMESANESETRSTLTFGTRAKKIKNVATPNIELSYDDLRKRYNRIKHLFDKCNSELLRWRAGEVVAEDDRNEIMFEDQLYSTAQHTTNMPTRAVRCTCVAPRTCSTCTPAPPPAAPSIPVIRGGTRHKCPCLVNLNEDPKEGEFLSIEIPEGVLFVGSCTEPGTVDIVLTGVLIHPIHCKLENRCGQVYLKTWSGNGGDAVVFVNGQLVPADEEITLTHGDRVIFGGAHYFRFTAPGGTVVVPGTSSTTRRVVDFEFAKSELINSVNNEKHWKLMTENSALSRDLQEAKDRISELTRELEMGHDFEQDRILNSTMREDRDTGDTSAMQRVSNLTAQLLDTILEGRVPRHDKNLQINSYLDSCIREEPLLSDQTFNLYLKMREATELCKLLSKNVVFKKEVIDLDDREDTCVRATDLATSATVVWSQETFFDRVETLKSFFERYQQEGSDITSMHLFQMLGCDDTWEESGSALSDEVSLISESFLSRSSFTSTSSRHGMKARSTSTTASQYSACLSQLSYLQMPPKLPADDPGDCGMTGNMYCDTLLDTVKSLYITLSSLDSNHRNTVSDLTYHVTYLHSVTGLWLQHTDPNQRLCQSVNGVVSVVKSIIQSLGEGCKVIEDVAAAQNLLLDVVYECGVICASVIGNEPERAVVGSRRGSFTSPDTRRNSPDLDVTSDYNSSSSSLNGGDVIELIRDRLLRGVQDHMISLLEGTTEVLTATLSAVRSASITPGNSPGNSPNSAGGVGDANCVAELGNYITRLTKQLRRKKEGFTKVFQGDPTPFSPLHCLVQQAGLSDEFIAQVGEVRSWSRIVAAAVVDTNNSSDSRHLIGQLNSKILAIIR